MLIPYRKFITCDFPGEVWTPCPPLDPHLGLSMVLSCTKSDYLCMFLEGQVDRQTEGCTDGQRPKQYPSDFIGGWGGGPVLSTGYLVLCSRTQRSASGEAQSRNPSISGQALLRHKAGQEGRGEILLENSFMR